MKKVFFTLILLFAIHSLYSQTTELEFNQAILLTSNDGLVTVPANKVWKVESILDETKSYRSSVEVSYPRGDQFNPDPCSGCALPCCTCNNREQRSYTWSDCSSSGYPVYINGSEITIPNGNTYTSNFQPNVGYAFWLPAGTTFKIEPAKKCYSIDVTYQPSGSSGTIFQDDYNDGTPRLRQCGTSAIAGNVVTVTRVVNITEFNVVTIP